MRLPARNTRPHPRPAGPLERLRAVFLALALASAAIAVPQTAASARFPAVGTVAVAAAAFALGALWLRGYRRGSFRFAGELPEALLVLAIVALSSGEALVPLFGILFRSLYGRGARGTLRLALYLGALYGGLQSAGAVVPGQNVGRAIGIALACCVTQALRAALESY